MNNSQCLFLRTSHHLSSVLLFFPSFFQLAFQTKCLFFNLSSPNLFVFQLLMPPVKFHWFHLLCKIHEKKNVLQVQTSDQFVLARTRGTQSNPHIHSLSDIISPDLSVNWKNK